MTVSPEHEHTEALGATSETMLNHVVRSLRKMAEHANTARGASWEHGARSATTLLDAADMLESLHLGCAIAYQREPTHRECAAHAGSLDEGVVPMGGWTIRRCVACRAWVAGGPTLCLLCIGRLEGQEQAQGTLGAISHRLRAWDAADSDGHSDSRRLGDALRALRDIARTLGVTHDAEP